MGREALYGLPEFGASDPDVVLAETLTASDRIPNPTGADIGTSVEFHSTYGARSVVGAAPWADYTEHRIFYDGPYGTNPTLAWDSKHAALAARLGVTFQFEVHRDLFDGVDQATYLTTAAAVIAPLMFRAAANQGLVQFSRGGTSGNATYNLTVGSNHTGVATGSAYLSKWANDKEFVPVVVSLRRRVLDIYIDGLHAISRTLSSWATTNFDDMYLVGKQFNYASNAAPAGFPYWMRNLQVLSRPVILPVNPVWDRIAFIGDSNVAQGDYHTNSPRVDAGHTGENCDAGMTPMVERLMHRDGYYTSDLHNVGRTGARILYVATATGLIDQVNGNNAGTEFDALEKSSTIGVVHAGLNDVLSETSTIANIKAQLKTVLNTMFDNGFRKIIVNNVFDAQNAISVSNSAATILSRTTDLNAAILDICNYTQNVYHNDIHAALGGTQNTDYFRAADLYHLKEQGQAIVGRAIYNVLKANVL